MKTETFFHLRSWEKWSKSGNKYFLLLLPLLFQCSPNKLFGTGLAFVPTSNKKRSALLKFDSAKTALLGRIYSLKPLWKGYIWPYIPRFVLILIQPCERLAARERMSVPICVYPRLARLLMTSIKHGHFYRIFSKLKCSGCLDIRQCLGVCSMCQDARICPSACINDLKYITGPVIPKLNTNFYFDSRERNCNFFSSSYFMRLANILT